MVHHYDQATHRMPASTAEAAQRAKVATGPDPATTPQAIMVLNRLQSLVPLYQGLLTDFRDRCNAAWAPYGGAPMGSGSASDNPVASDALEPIYELERIAQNMAEVVASFRQVTG